MNKSWRTTLSGIFAGITLLLGQAQTLLDDDPETNPEYTVIVAAIGMISLGINSRDQTVSSEDQGIKPGRIPRPPM
jgi:hypothetical protein